MQFYEVVIKPILTNQIVVDWIAPIITGLIVVAIPAILAKFFRNKSFQKSINLVNSKIIDTIRPFIIQRIEITPDFISGVRVAIIKENSIKEKYIYTEIEIRNKILLDISETRFLAEKEKQELIEFTNKIFGKFSKTLSKTKANDEELEEQKLKWIQKITYLICFVASLVTMLIAYIIKPVGENLEDNVVIILTLITAIVSMALLFSEQFFYEPIDFSIKLIDNDYKKMIKKIRRRYKK